jgi:ATP-dependent Clp protease, protease subunit
MNMKKIILGLIGLIALTVYPAISNGKSEKSDNRLVFSDNNLVVLNTEINDQTVAATIQKLRQIDSCFLHKNDPIYLWLYSPGGSIQAGLELKEAASGLCRPVHTVTLFSASMAFQLVQQLGTRDILANGVLMSHRAAGGFEGSFGGQSPSQLDSRYALWLKRTQEMDEQTVKRTHGKQTLQSYRKQYDNEMWITGLQAVEQGYADEIVTISCNSSLNGTIPHEVEFLGAVITYETSKCPIITGPLNVKVTMPGDKGNSIIINDIKEKFLASQDFEKNIK